MLAQLIAITALNLLNLSPTDPRAMHDQLLEGCTPCCHLGLYLRLASDHRYAAATLDRAGPLSAELARLNDTLAVAILLCCGADPNATGANGVSTVDNAVFNGNTLLVNLLRRAGAKDSIFVAVATGDRVTVQHFLASDPRAGAATLYGLGLADVAIIADQREILAELMRVNKPNRASENSLGESPLSVAAEWDRPGIIALLVDQYGADPNVVSSSGFGPLHVAARYGSSRAAVALISRGADASMPTDDGDTPLEIAARSGKRKVLRILLDVPQKFPDDQKVPSISRGE